MPEGMSNPLSNYLTTKRKPALGPTLSALVDATLWLAKAEQISSDGKDVHVAEVFKSRNSACFSCLLYPLVLTLALGNKETVLLLHRKWCYFSVLNHLVRYVSAITVAGFIVLNFTEVSKI